MQFTNIIIAGKQSAYKLKFIASPIKMDSYDC